MARLEMTLHYDEPKRPTAEVVLRTALANLGCLREVERNQTGKKSKANWEIDILMLSDSAHIVFRTQDRDAPSQKAALAHIADLRKVATSK